MKIDKVRIIIGTNTQTRRISVLAQILRIIHRGVYPLSIIKGKSMIWSRQEEIKLKAYKISTGKLTESGKETNAFSFYISLLEDLKLITRLNEFTRCTKYGLIFNLLEESLGLDLKEKEKKKEILEKIFFFYFLFREDADGLITLMQILSNSDVGLKEIEIRKSFGSAIANRLKSKAILSSGRVRIETEQKYREFESRTINLRGSAFKHHVPNRLNWLITLELVVKSGNYYFLSRKGVKLLKKELLEIQDGLIDIYSDWLNKCKWRYLLDKEEEVSEKETAHIQLIGKAFVEYFNYMGDDGSFRLSFLPVYIFTSMNLAISKGLILTQEKLTQILSPGIRFENKGFQLKLSPRITESYINIS